MTVKSFVFVRRQADSHSNRNTAWAWMRMALIAALFVSGSACSQQSGQDVAPTPDAPESIPHDVNPKLISCPTDTRATPADDSQSNRPQFVRFEFTVDTVGYVDPATIRRVPDRRQRREVQRELVDYAREMAAQCRYEPAMLARSPVNSVTEVTIVVYQSSGG